MIKEIENEETLGYSVYTLTDGEAGDNDIFDIPTYEAASAIFDEAVAYEEQYKKDNPDTFEETTVHLYDPVMGNMLRETVIS